MRVDTAFAKVYHPTHYNRGKIEVIDFIEDQQLGFHLGNVIKYICRLESKGERIQDLEKALWYLERYIRLEQSKLEVDANTVT